MPHAGFVRIGAFTETRATKVTGVVRKRPDDPHLRSSIPDTETGSEIHCSLGAVNKPIVSYVSSACISINTHRIQKYRSNLEDQYLP